MDGIRISYIDEGILKNLWLPSAEIETQKTIKHRYDEAKKTKPWERIQLGEYFELNFKVKVALYPEAFNELEAFLQAAPEYILQYTVGEVNKQYEVTVKKLPKCSNDMRLFADTAEFELSASFETEPSPIITEIFNTQNMIILQGE